MANEVSHRHSATGDTLYFTIRNVARQMWNTAGTPNFEALTVANWGDYDVALAESPASSYFYAGTFPAVGGNMVAGWYWVDVFKRAGGSPAIADALQASYFGYWDGTTFKWWADDVLQVNGTGQTARDLGAQLDAAVSTRAAASIFTGMTSAANWLRGLFRKSAMDATAKTEVNSGGGTYDETSDSNEGIRDTAPLGTAMRGTDSAALASDWTSGRAAKLDYIPAGTMPTQAEVLAIQNNTRVRVIVPPCIERPDSGSTTYRLWMYLYDEIGNMEAPDSLPTLAAQNNVGTDRSANLSAVTNPSTGVYYADYTVAAAHAIEGLLFEWTVLEGGLTRKHGAAALVVDTTAVDFTAADRTKLDALHDTRLTDARATKLDNLDVASSAIKAKTDNLPAFSIAEPTAKPTTWDGWFMWAIQRFRRASKTPTTLLIKTEAGATVTTQALTDDGAGTETLGPPT